jgi:mono/diheme cytochrome c family protein
MPERPTDPDLERSTNRWLAWGLVLIGAAVLAFPLYRLYEPSGREEAREVHLASLADQGAVLYQTNCASCHGADGLGGAGPALNAKQFLADASDEQIRQLIAVGVPGSTMGAYSLDFGGALTLEQIDAVTVFLRSLEETAADFPGWRDPLNNAPVALPMTTMPVPTEPDEGDGDETVGDDPMARGEAVYTASCAACHGADLGGLAGPALGPGSGAAALSEEEFLEVITGGRNAMPAFTGVLDAEETAAVIAFLRDAQG